MPLKKFKPKTSTLRGTVIEDRSGLDKPKKIRKLQKSGRKGGSARNNMGRVTVRHKGGRQKRRYRVVDFKRDKFDIPAEIVSVEYDPNRSANIALVQYTDGEKRYILCPKGLKVGDNVVSSKTEAPFKPGNSMPLKVIPSGTYVHSVELAAGKGAQLGRSAGASIQVQGNVGKYTQLKLPSGEIRLVLGDCRATIGRVGNEEHGHVKLGKAGRSRRKGRRPAVRGMAMHAKQHPHGGGEGKGQVGGQAKDIYGHRVGTRTSTKKRRGTDRFIVKRRKTKRNPATKKSTRRVRGTKVLEEGEEK